MAESFYTIIPTQTDEEVREYIVNRRKYVPEAVEIAIAELTKRGKGLSEEELSSIRGDVAAIETERKKSSDNSSFFGYWKKNIVEDPNAPELYSERAIWGFSFGMMPLFGAVLFSMNLYRLGKQIHIPFIVGGGILWYVLVLFVTPDHHGTHIVYFVNGIGGMVLCYLVWPRLIGREFKYRRRPIWIPLTIAVILAGIFLFAVLQ